VAERRTIQPLQKPRLRSAPAEGNCPQIGIKKGVWPKVLLAAKTYANDPLKPALSVGFCTFEGQSSNFSPS